MSPILLRPVREQLEHDRLIRLLQAKYRRKFEVAINPGNEQTAPVQVGQSPWYPDLVLQSQDRGRKLMGVVEVETAESVNNLEAMSQWGTFGRLRAPFHLYIPSTMIDVGRRLCEDLQIPVAELWSYDAIGDQMRFTLVQRSSRGGDEKRTSAGTRAARPAARRPAAAAGARTSRSATPRRAAGGATSRRKAAKKSTTRAATSRKRPSRPSRAQKRK